MSDNGYDEDFEDYDEDFESDNELEVPDQPLVVSADVAGLLSDAWPSLTSAAAVKQKHRTSTFTRSLISNAASSGTPKSATADGSSYTISPAPPPLTDSQRSRASKTLTRSLQHQQQVILTHSPVYDLLVLQSMSLYQQLTLGVGAYASSRAAANQTRQMDQELQEQDVQTEDVEVHDSSCQVPDVATSNSSIRPFTRSTSSSGIQAAAVAGAKSSAAAAASKLLESDAGLSDFIDWAVPELVFELGKAAAVAAAVAEEGSKVASTQQGLPFRPSNVSETVAARGSSAAGFQKRLMSGHINLQCIDLLIGRAVLSVVCPPTPAAAVAAAAAISTGVAAVVSSHLLLSCCSPAVMTAEAALKEHGLPGLGCLCVWDLMQQQAAAAPVQLLVCEGQPTCCCWGTGAASHLVFAGMEEGCICCWDLSEPDSSHMQQQQQSAPSTKQQQQQGLPGPRRPSYTTHTSLPPIDGGSSTSVAPAAEDTADRIVAVAVVPPAAGNVSGGAAAGGAVCQLVSLSSIGNVVLYSVMVSSASAAAAAADLGVRIGSCVWLVKIVEGISLGVDAAKPPHLRTLPTAATMHAASLAQLPGQGQQILVGTCGGMILKGACLGTPAAPREYLAADYGLLALKAQQDLAQSSSASASKQGPDTATVSDKHCRSSSSCLGSVVSLSVCPLVPDAWLAGFSSGSVALFSSSRSRPVMMWQQLRSAPVVAVRWIPTRPCTFVVLHADGKLLAFDLSQNSKQPLVLADLQLIPAAAPAGSHSPAAAQYSSTPCSLEILVHNTGSTAAAAADAEPAPDVSSSGSNRDIRFRSTSSNAGRRNGATTGREPTGLAAYCSLAIGYNTGSTLVYQLEEEWCQQQQQEDQLLQHLLIA